MSRLALVLIALRRRSAPMATAVAACLIAASLSVLIIERLAPDEIVEVDILYTLPAACAVWFMPRSQSLVVISIALLIPAVGAFLGEASFATASVQVLAVAIVSIVARFALSAVVRDARSEMARTISGVKAERLQQLSHELRTPLTAVMGYAGLLEGDPELKGHRKEIRRILEGADRLNKVIDDVLAVDPWWVDTRGLPNGNVTQDEPVSQPNEGVGGGRQSL